jgi:hypothetical protein
VNRRIRARLARSCVAFAASVVVLSGAGVTPVAAAGTYTPTMKDMLSIQGAIERYLRGMDTRDQKLQESAFWDDAVMISPQGKRPAKRSGGPGPAGGPGAPGGAGGPGGPGGPPPGAAGAPAAGGPPANINIPVGANGLPERPPSCDPKAEKPANGWDLWHIVANSTYEFLSPTRVKHHAYWFAVCPSAGGANGAGIAAVGPPGSYNDILEKRNGEWRFIQRNIPLNVKYADKD